MPNRQILIIDDEEDIREVAQASLELVAGWKITTAMSGFDGLHKAISEQPEAILLDLMMPDMDGMMTFFKLRAQAATQHIPVIFMTAKVQASDRHRLTQAGAMAVIIKPFDPLKLHPQVAEALGWPR
jgi:CheY-like chemotaxis protein